MKKVSINGFINGFLSDPENPEIGKSNGEKQAMDFLGSFQTCSLETKASGLDVTKECLNQKPLAVCLAGFGCGLKIGRQIERVFVPPEMPNHGIGTEEKLLFGQSHSIKPEGGFTRWRSQGIKTKTLVVIGNSQIFCRPEDVVPAFGDDGALESTGVKFSIAKHNNWYILWQQGMDFFQEFARQFLRSMPFLVLENTPAQRNFRQHLDEITSVNHHLERLIAELTEKLAAALNEVSEVNFFKSAFIAQASHEFRTPLAIIQLALEILEHCEQSPDTDIQDEKQAHYDIIYEEIEKMVLLLNDLLRIETITRNQLHKFQQGIIDDKRWRNAAQSRS